MRQRSLIPPESIPPRARYEKLFENLPDVPSTCTGRGRPPFSREALLKGLIYRNLRGIHKLVELELELSNNPSICESLGFDPLRKPPSDERFSQFLRSNHNSYFQIIKKALVQELIYEGAISAQSVGLNSCPIEAFVKENNLKTSTKDRYQKHRLLPGDKDARLVMGDEWGTLSSRQGSSRNSHLPPSPSQNRTSGFPIYTGPRLIFQIASALGNVGDEYLCNSANL